MGRIILPATSNANVKGLRPGQVALFADSEKGGNLSFKKDDNTVKDLTEGGTNLDTVIDNSDTEKTDSFRELIVDVNTEIDNAINIAFPVQFLGTLTYNDLSVGKLVGKGFAIPVDNPTWIPNSFQLYYKGLLLNKKSSWNMIVNLSNQLSTSNGSGQNGYFFRILDPNILKELEAAVDGGTDALAKYLSDTFILLGVNGFKSAVTVEKGATEIQNRIDAVEADIITLKDLVTQYESEYKGATPERQAELDKLIADVKRKVSILNGELDALLEKQSQLK